MTTFLKRRSLPSLSLEWLRSPWCISLSVVLGIYIGTSHKPLAEAITPVGNLYLGLLKMCVLPILLSAISNSIGRLMQSHDAKQYVQRILVVFPTAMVAVSGLAVVVASITGPGRNLSTATLESLGGLVNQSSIDLEVSLSGPLPVEEAGPDVGSFLVSMVPDNIFSALSEGQTLRVLIFAIVFGVSLGLIKTAKTEAMFDVLDSIYQAFNQVIHWLTYLLPIGLCSLLATQLSKIGLDVLFSMVNFVVVAMALFAAVYIVGTGVICWRSKQSLWTVLRALKDPTILALATTSSLACLPAAIASLHEDLNFDRQTTDLVTPLSITVCRFGSIIYFAAATMFVMQLYQKPLDFGTLWVILVGSVLAGMATSGVTGILTLTMLGLVLAPLKLPLDAVLVLFVAIDPIINPFRTLSIVHTGMATTSVIANLHTEHQPAVASASGFPTEAV
ncbi:MAG: cation:dicarboxylase symporter family transporter [Cyanobacteria bacterium P01_D01_bin.115]